MLYERLHDYLETYENHPRWIRGIYPTRTDAEEGFEKGWLYVAEADGKVAGSVIHVLAVLPDFFGMGVGKALLDYACSMGRENGIGAVRLDVYEKLL